MNGGGDFSKTRDGGYAKRIPLLLKNGKCRNHLIKNLIA